PRPRRRERHAQVAEFLEAATSETGEAAAALGRHWRDAGEHEHAIEHLVEAAEEAERGWAKDRGGLIQVRGRPGWGSAQPSSMASKSRSTVTVKRSERTVRASRLGMWKRSSGMTPRSSGSIQ